MRIAKKMFHRLSLKIVKNFRFNCLRQLTMGEADFTILEPEDLLVAVAYEEWPILVTHELRAFPKGKR